MKYMTPRKPLGYTQHPLFDWIIARSAVGILLLFLLTVLPGFLTACQTSMSVEQAKQVVVEMQRDSFVPPPRRINDVLAFLDKAKLSDSPAVKRLQSTLSAPPPDASKQSLIIPYLIRRGTAAMKLGLYNQALSDLRLAKIYADKNAMPNAELLHKLGYAEFVCGNFKDAVAYFEQSNKIKEKPETYRALVELYTRVGDLDAAEETKRRGVMLCNFLCSRQVSCRWCDYHTAMMNAYVLDARGKFSEAESFYRQALRSITPAMKKSFPFVSIVPRIYLTRNLKHQEEWIKAELAARDLLKETVSATGSDSETFGIVVGDLSDILMRQGRLEEAEKLLHAALSILETAGIEEYAYPMIDARMRLGNVLFVKGNYTGAMEQFDLTKSEARGNRYLYDNLFARNPALMLSLIMTARIDEAMALIDTFYQRNKAFVGPSHYLTKEILGLRAVAHARLHNDKLALKDFSGAIPYLLNNEQQAAAAFDQRRRARIIMESYIDLLIRAQDSGLANQLDIDALGEAFKLVDAMSSPMVRGAVGASTIRAAVISSELTKLVRQEQDASKRIEVIERMLTNHLAAPLDQQIPRAINELKRELDTLSAARRALREEIQSRFPKYSELASPQQVSILQVQQQLCPGEVFLSIFVADARTYVWAIPKTGRIGLFATPVGKDQLNRYVLALRRSLDPHPKTLGDIPAFDINAAYQLYRLLLAPVEENWRHATNLLVVTNSPLDKIPFSVLVTAPIAFEKDSKTLFEEYRKVPWLIRKTSINRLTSASTFVSLRKAPQGDPSRKAFVGFGDPLFNSEQLAMAGGEVSRRQDKFATRGASIQVRGIRTTNTGSLDSNKMNSSRLQHLNRLPDTADEVKSIAETLGADFQRDVFLGRQASEKRVKSMDLTDRKVIVFATHALVPGDLDGLTQPALAMCAPELTGESEDGLLTMGEIMTLQIDADWVVLSACNTGAADDKGAEAVSGLGRAFFYAGTRSLLLSMWPVETTSARKLTTGVFKHAQKTLQLSRPAALRAAMLDLIDQAYLQDSDSGQIIASYAHPLFWAPFIVVGDCGVRFDQGIR